MGWAVLGSQGDFLVLDLALGSRVEFAHVGRGGEWLGQNPGCGSESLRVGVRGTGARDSNAGLDAQPRWHPRWGEGGALGGKHDQPFSPASQKRCLGWI